MTGLMSGIGLTHPKPAPILQGKALREDSTGPATTTGGLTSKMGEKARKPRARDIPVDFALAAMIWFAMQPADFKPSGPALIAA